MLDLPRYLLGIAELAIVAGSAGFAASALRARLLPDFSGAPALLATSVLAAALLIWTAELLGTFGAFEPLWYVLLVALGGLSLGTYLGRVAPQGGTAPEEASATAGGGGPHAATGPARQSSMIPTLVALAIAALAVAHFAADLRPKLTTGMTGFDSTWYHGPFAAGFFQSGDTWDLHHIAPQFLAWFYPANAELFHGIGMLAFDRDLLSPLLNLGWLVGCLLACWCIGRPYGVASWSLALGAVVLTVPALSDQAGEARNDLAAIFFLLAAVAVALNAGGGGARRPLRIGVLAVIGLAAGLAAGTKLNYMVPAAVLVVGVALVVEPGRRWRALITTLLAALAGGGYWYLRNLMHAGNPLPWFDNLGPVALPAPEQELGGREGHSVAGYLFDGSVWSEWLLPGLHHGLTILWPALVLVAAAGLLLCIGPRAEPTLRLAALAGIAAAFAWLLAPTSASGPEGMARGFESGLRYLAPALTLGMALLPLSPALRERVHRLGSGGTGNPADGRMLKVPGSLARHLSGPGVPPVRTAMVLLLVAAAAAAALGYPVQRHYLDNRYASPDFSTPGLDAAFRWSRSISDARIATTSTRQYPLFGNDLSNRVQFVGERRPHGGFVAPTSCRAWRRLLDAGHFDYVVASRDRIEPGKPPYPLAAKWTEGPGAAVILREPPTVIFKLTDPPDPSGCGPRRAD
ncbi:MAG TPA: hypothetical protein VGF04_06005 [Solirubrobacterales bacterium]